MVFTSSTRFKNATDAELAAGWVLKNGEDNHVPGFFQFLTRRETYKGVIYETRK
jgi:hypothetical protein